MNIYFKIEHREYQAKKLHIDRQENYKTSEYTFFLKHDYVTFCHGFQKANESQVFFIKGIVFLTLMKCF